MIVGLRRASHASMRTDPSGKATADGTPTLAEGGMWSWSMTVTLPGLRFPFPISGKEPTRKEAGRRVVECYEQMLQLYCKL